MIEHTPNTALAVLPPLHEVALNHGFARAVTEGLVDGRLWTHRADGAQVAHALHPYGMSLVWGAHLERVLEPLARHLRGGHYRRADEWLQIDPRAEQLDWDRWLDAVPGEPDQAPAGPRVQRYTRVNFRFDAALFMQRHAMARAPNNWQIRAMTAAEFDLNGVSVTPRAFWRDSAQFLAHGGGLCAQRDGEVGAIGFSSFRFDRTLEIGIETRPAQRGQGLALAVAIALIRRILAEGLEPVWSCRKENAASLALARRLGFVVTRQLPYYRLPAPT